MGCWKPVDATCDTALDDGRYLHQLVPVSKRHHWPLNRLAKIRPHPIIFTISLNSASPMTQTDLLSSERSELSGRYTEGGITVTVEIFRPSGSDDWRMEVTSLEDQVTDWNESFASAHEAWDEFIYVVNTEGLAVFL